MAYSEWQQCQMGLADLKQCQKLSKRSYKPDEDTDVQIDIVKTPDNKRKGSKRKQIIAKKQLIQSGTSNLGHRHKTETASQFLLGFQDLAQKDRNEIKDIDWSDSSSNDDLPAPSQVLKRRRTGNIKRGFSSKIKHSSLLLHQTLNSMSSTPPEIKSFEIDLLSTPLKNFDNKKISTSIKNQVPVKNNTPDSLQVVPSQVKYQLISQNISTNTKTVLKKKTKNSFYLSGKESEELVESICEVDSESDSDDVPSSGNHNEDIESSDNETDFKQPLEDNYLETDTSGISSVNSTQTDTIRASDWVMVDQKLSTPVKTSNIGLEHGEDSTKKKKKFTKGTLAGRLNQLMKWETSSVRFWYHSLDSGILDETKKKTLILKITSLKPHFSIYICDCQIIGTAEICRTIISKQTFEKLKLKFGTVIQIFPPWQELKESSGVRTLLCANFIKVVSTSDLAICSESNKEVDTIITVTFKWSCPCTTEEHIMSSSCPAFRHPAKIHSEVSPTPSTSIRLYSVNESMSLSQTSRTLLQSMKGTESNCSCLASFVGTVLRVLRNKDPSTSNIRYQLLVEDTAGTVMLISVPISYTGVENIYSLEGQKCSFTGLCTVVRTNIDRQQDLFTLVDLFWTQSLVQSSNESSEQTDLVSMMKSPNFAYVLESPVGAESQFNVHLVERRNRTDNLELRKLNEINQLNCRISFLAKVITSSKETENKVYVYDDSRNKANETIVVSIEVDKSCVFDANLPVALFQDIWCKKGLLLADSFTGIFSSDFCERNKSVESSTWTRIESVKMYLPLVSAKSSKGCFVQVKGLVTNIDEDTAYTWEECDLCSGDKLVTLPDTGLIFCQDCQRQVNSPKNKMKMEVFVHVTLSNIIVKIDLTQATILSLLPSEPDDEGYEMNQVTNKLISCPICLVQDDISDGHMFGAKLSLLELNYN